MHFIEFSRAATKLKNLIDEFIVPEETLKMEDTVEYLDQSVFENDFEEGKIMKEEISEETEIIRRLQESGQVSLKIKKINEIVTNRKIKKETPVKKKIDQVFFRKIVQQNTRGRKPKDKHLFSCPNCPLKFDKFSLMREHERLTHKFICHFCGRSYTVKLNLKMHIFREHKGIRTFCSDCGIQTMDLAEHMKKHLNEQIFVCDICGKEVRGKQRINNHMNRSHKSRLARFFCSFCDKGFRYMADLNEHAIKHNPDKKDHKCLECGKAYKRRPELKRHMESHTGQKWPCLDCGREFAWKRGLGTHKSKGSCKGFVE